MQCPASPGGWAVAAAAAAAAGQLTQGRWARAKLPCRRLRVAALLQQHACVGTGRDQTKQEGRAQTHHAASDRRSTVPLGLLWPCSKADPRRWPRVCVSEGSQEPTWERCCRRPAGAPSLLASAKAGPRLLQGPGPRHSWMAQLRQNTRLALANDEMPQSLGGSGPRTRARKQERGQAAAAERQQQTRQLGDRNTGMS